MVCALCAGCTKVKDNPDPTPQQTEKTDSAPDSKKEESSKDSAETGDNSKNEKAPDISQGQWGDFDWSQYGDADWSQFGEGDWSEWADWYNQNNNQNSNSQNSDDKPQAEPPKADTKETEAKEYEVSRLALYFDADGSWAFGSTNKLYGNDVILDIYAPEGATVYYTTDGSTPNDESRRYKDSITLTAHGGSFPSAYSFRAVAVYADGTKSQVAARNILASSKLDGRYSTLIFCVSGEPDELTKKPNGIFTGKNYEQRGRESERKIYLDVFRADGSSVISQYAGVRIYGGYSRRQTMKSMKLFSRKSYDEDHKNFKLNDFGTLKLDGSGDVISKYDKLVLRNSGNDFQFAFIRDELSQTLCKKAGFECYEAVLPAICYLNGEYYGFFWLHENYCDKYFKEKYGDAEGEFVILEGGDQEKLDDDDPFVQKYVDEYNAKYNQFIKMDLNNDSNYKQLCNYIDVESYLDFFAWNIALNNWDWPNNNYKLFRYVEASASALSAEGAAVTPDNKVYDGRWRFLPHDMDYTYNLYDQNIAMYNYNTLKVVMSKNDERYAPLFTKLMDRSDCRAYFRAKTMEYLEGALSEESIVSTYYELHATRSDELAYFYKYIEQQNRKGDRDMWATPSNYNGTESGILEFAKKRAAYVIKYMDKLLPEK